MGFTGCRIRESLVAIPTAERLLSCVNTHVSLEITSVGEFLPTVLERRKYVMKRLSITTATVMSSAISQLAVKKKY